MPLYARTNSDEDLEAEIKALEEAANEATPPANKEEDQTWKKRYGDLRRFQQDEVKKANEEKEALRRQLEAATKQKIEFPAKTEDVEAWLKKFPDVGKIVRTLAMQESSTVTEEIENLRKQINEEKTSTAKERAMFEIEKAHPDFFSDIAPSDEFNDWLDKRSQAMQDALRVNDTDSRIAIEVIDYYKSSAKPVKKTERKNDKDAARGFSTRQTITAPTNSGDYLFSESQLKQMNPSEYDKYEEAIDKAIAEGKFLYDLSGGSR